ncbi:MAG: DUF4422 domain-containing protein [Lachnospiraceae bacterium]|nr:DUF4422 domain-containing protein [Lachnospiraceae bacterium]
MQLVIYGAQGYALGAYEALKSLYPKRAVKCFLVTEMGGNAPMLGGIPVREIASYSEGVSAEERDNTEVLIATPENVQAEIEETLESHGFRHHVRLDSERWSELVKLYHARLGWFLPLPTLPVGCSTPFVRMYMAKSHKDRPLRQDMKLPDYIFPLQVGAAGTDTRIAGLTDDMGDNISERNGNYSELTGLYLIWKSKLMSEGVSDGDDGQYYGLVQYRRVLGLSDDDLLRLVDNDVDAVLPYPLPYEPNIHAHHERYLKEADWRALLTALKEIQPEYFDAFPKILEQKYLYNYNVILARKRVLREYCEWLFPILLRTEELSEPKGSDRSDRYIGYIGETLETLYFMKNADRLNEAHVGCKLLV